MWADPTSVGNYQEFFDLGNGAYCDNIVLYRLGTTNNLAFVVYQGAPQGGRHGAANAITLEPWQYLRRDRWTPRAT